MYRVYYVVLATLELTMRAGWHQIQGFTASAPQEQDEKRAPHVQLH